MSLSYRLADIARDIGAELKGDGERLIFGINTLQQAGNNEITFLANAKYRQYLATTQAAAVILDARSASACPTDALVCPEPYVAYARASVLFDKAARERVSAHGVHPTAVIGEGCEIDSSCSIGPRAVLGQGVSIAAGVSIGAGCVLGDGVQIGADSVLHANVTLYSAVCLGQRCIIHSGAVLGSDGFGYANTQGQWVKIAQLGAVRLHDDVEIGANTAVDCGALGDTVIERGVKIDNFVQVAHNVHIGEHTAIAGCVAIAGSAKIGRYCSIAGHVGIAGHLEIADHVTVMAKTLVSRSIAKSGVYSSGAGSAQPVSEWRKNVVRFRQLDTLFRRVSQLEAISKRHE